MSKVRLNIYLLEPEIRRRVKMAAARQDISLSAYCYQAIRKARRFLKGTFAGRSFRVSSSTLIAQARKERVKKPWGLGAWISNSIHAFAPGVCHSLLLRSIAGGWRVACLFLETGEIR